MRLKLEEIPFEFDGKTYLLRANMAVLEEVQEAHRGDLSEVLEGDNPIGSVMEFLTAMLNDYADEQGWPERFTKKQISRKFSIGSLRGSGLIEQVMGLVIRSMRVSDPDTEEVQTPDASPETEGN